MSVESFYEKVGQNNKLKTRSIITYESCLRALVMISEELSVYCFEEEKRTRNTIVRI